MSPKLLKVCTAVLLVLLAARGWTVLRPADAIVREEAAVIAELARRMNIRNLVSAVYLGPRVFDTFLEVMVVVLAVTGMKFIREEP